MMDADTQRTLLSAARAVAHRAYAPYSRFRVGAAVLDADGGIHTGCNVENAAYGSTVCAEVNAITSAVATGSIDLVAIAVSALDGEDVHPCGNCRQVFREFTIDECIIDHRDGPVVQSLEGLLPHSFGPEDLS